MFCESTVFPLKGFLPGIFKRTHSHRKKGLWGPYDLDLWPPKSNQFILESNSTLVPKFKKFPRGDPEISCSKTMGQTYVGIDALQPPSQRIIKRSENNINSFTTAADWECGAHRLSGEDHRVGVLLLEASGLQMSLSSPLPVWHPACSRSALCPNPTRAGLTCL